MVMAQRKIEYEEDFSVGRNYSESDHSANQRTVVKASTSKKTSSHRGIKSIVVMLCIVAIFGLIGAKTVYVTVVKAAEISQLKTVMETLNSENELLQVEVDKLRSVDRIEKAALALGMEKPEGTIYLVGSLINTEETAGAESIQENVIIDEKDQDSLLSGIFKKFTSYFASTMK